MRKDWWCVASFLAARLDKDVLHWLSDVGSNANKQASCQGGKMLYYYCLNERTFYSMHTVLIWY